MALSKLRVAIFLIIVISISANIFLLVKVNDLQKNYDSASESSFRFVKPLAKVSVASNLQPESFIIHFSSLRETLEKTIEKYNATGNVGVFVQDAKTGAWLGIDERIGYTPASLLKVPLMMSILKKVERGEIELDDEIALKEEDLDSNYGILYKAGAGAKRTVLELLKEMVLYSDNTAKSALFRQLSDNEVDAVFTHVGIPNPYLLVNPPTVSPRNYARIFKSLYFSTFLPPELSEKALELTTDTQTENLISAGVPAEIQVAHKFGIVLGEVSVHDCGIVYHPINPYFLCVMTRDVDYSVSPKLISEISKDVYVFVDAQ